MSELRWLVALEAGLFFSVVCWDTTASWAAPTYEPVPFILALVGAATVGMLTCHVGPAFYASRFAVPGWVMAWLAFGYLEWLWGMGEAMWDQWGWPRWTGFAVAAALVWVRPAWRAGTAFGLALGAGILGWALQAQWHGIWKARPDYETETIFGYFTPGVLLAAAPAVVISWKIGQLRVGPKAIWWSGFWGVWLPAVVGIAVASVAADAGGTLYWTPSLFRGFYWALQGVDGLNGIAAALVYGPTLLGPAIASVYSLQQLRREWTGRWELQFLPLGLWAAAWGVSQWTGPGDGLQFFFFTAPHRWWAWGVVALSAAAGLRVLFLPVSGKMQYHHRDNV